MNLNPFSRPKEDPLEPVKQAAAVNAVTPFMSPQTASDAQVERELGIDKLLLEDAGLLTFIEKLCQYEVTEVIQVPTVSLDSQGAPILEETIALDPAGQPMALNGRPILIKKPMVLMVPKAVTTVRERPWAYAVRAYLSHMFSGRSIDPYEADTFKLQARCDFADLEDSMPAEDYANFLYLVKVLERHVESSFDDSRSDGRIGRKAGLLKVRRGELSVGVGQPKPVNNGGK